ncbi:MAG: MarR family transcriptional regulator [Clostridia bacterium]|nr:MarR family transcriptional regulator [Clostridia bacterium]
MAKFMKILNNISRSQALFRRHRVSADDLQSGHYAFALAICREPGRSQEELARELCINKSTVTRNLNVLEENGYVEKRTLSTDKRQFAVYPTEKLTVVLPEIKAASLEWMELLSEGISEEELEVFNSVLLRMESRAREITERQDNSK